GRQDRRAGVRRGDRLRPARGGSRQPARSGSVSGLACGRRASGGALMLKIDNLHAFYGKSHVLHGVQFEVGEGEIVALLGRNGSGRSTTAKAIMGMVQCSGAVEWKGRNILGLKP